LKKDQGASVASDKFLRREKEIEIGRGERRGGGFLSGAKRRMKD